MIVVRADPSKVKHSVMLNHQSPQKLRKQIKAQQEIGFDKVTKDFRKLYNEIMHEKNFAELRIHHNHQLK